jgi:hypothetical protein
MISARIDDKKFFKDMSNILGYSEGFLEGIQKGKKEFLESIAKEGIEIFKEFVDQQARVDPDMYHHIYEWYREGSPDSRLFDIEYAVNNGGLTFFGQFTQSSSVSAGSSTPFYDKARIMEYGIPVTIKPKKAKVLSFNVGEDSVFTKNPITIDKPGGPLVTGSFNRIFDIFFKDHFRQSVLEITGIRKYLSNPISYKQNLSAGKNLGKAKGIQVGYTWITEAGGLNV